MNITIANGLLTTNHAASSAGQTVFVFNGIAYGPDDLVDFGKGTDSTNKTLARDLVEDGYSAQIIKGHQFSLAEYNLIAEFAGMPSANLCSGE